MHWTWFFALLRSAITLITSGVILNGQDDRHGKGPSRGKTCVVKSGGQNTTDDAVAIRGAFRKCGGGGRVVFKPTTYYINTVLNVTGLEDVDIDILGELSWGTNITYWLNNSLPVGFQNHSTAFVLGGINVRINGYNKGTFNGNGDVWYKFIRAQPNTSNYPGRPHAITFIGLTNSVVRGLRFLRSQMTMSIIHSHPVDFYDIFINNTGNTYQSSSTDDADTIDSSFIKMDNWTIYNGDDSISLRETFYFKTWTADCNGYPPNGGGGGYGIARDLNVKGIRIAGLRGRAVTISQCTRFIGAPGSGNCTNSEFEIRDITVQNMKGTTRDSRVASFQCSAVKPCTNIALLDVDLTFNNGTNAARYLCGNVVAPRGFNCTGSPCVGGSSTGGC